MTAHLPATPPRRRAVPIGLVSTCRTLLIIGIGRDIGPRIRHAKLFDWYKIHVMWPELPPDLVALTTDDDRFVLHYRLPVEEDIARAEVIIEDCEDHALAEQITGWARTHRRLINAIDKPVLCDLYYMSLVFRGPLSLAITSDGDAPALAAALRRWLETNLTPGWTVAASEMAALRQRLPSGQARKRMLLSLASNEVLLGLIEEGDEQGIKDLFADAVRSL
jgi:siroheme synthase-like protein